VGLSPPAVKPSTVAERQATRGRRWVPWLVLGLYLAAAVTLTWQLWQDPAGRSPTLGHAVVSDDVFLNAWYMRYAAIAISHGHLPALVSTAMNYPQGANAMWNTSFLLPGVLLTPVTLVAGPLTSLTVATTLGFAGSAAALFFVLRRWGVSDVPAAIGGAVYGFSPALTLAAEDHYHLQFAVLIPLIVDAVLRLATGRSRPVHGGIVLGLLVSAQLFIAEELLVDTALATLIILIVLIASRPSQVLVRIRGALAGFGIALAVAAVLCGYALKVQFAGPLAEHGSPWHIGQYGNQPADFVTAPSSLVLHGATFASFLVDSSQRLVEYFAYVGWPLLAVALLATIFYWRDIRVRVAGLAFFLVDALSVGGHVVRFGSWRYPPAWLPWHWLERLPVLQQVLPNRLSIIADGAAAALLAFALHRALTDRPEQRRWRLPTAAAVTALVLVPLIPLPVPTAAAPPLPTGWKTTMKWLHLPAGAPVLVLPIDPGQAMEWQAVTGEQFSVVGGYCIAPTPTGQAAGCNTYRTLTSFEQSTVLRLNNLSLGVRRARGPSRLLMSEALEDWQPSAVVSSMGGATKLGRYLRRFFGRPTIRYRSMLAWRVYWRTYCPRGASKKAPPGQPIVAGTNCTSVFWVKH
jgi:hypothetical protein